MYSSRVKARLKERLSFTDDFFQVTNEGKERKIWSRELLSIRIRTR